MTTKNDNQDIEQELGAGGEVVAYMLGHRFRDFEGAPRAEIADVFERHGFPDTAKTVRETDAAKAASAAVSRKGKSACEQRARKLKKRGRVVKFVVRDLEAADDHKKAWGVVREERLEGERGARWGVGARIFVAGDGLIHVAAPVDSEADEDCTRIAEEIASHARWLVNNADSNDASLALTKAYQEAQAVPFIARGLYLARTANAATERIVALASEVRRRYYDEEARTGIRATAVRVTKQDEGSVSDALIDSFEKRAEELVDQLRSEAGDSKVRASTLQKRRDTAAAFLRDLGPVRDLLGAWVEQFQKIGAAVEQAYGAGVEAVDISVPEWLREEQDEEDSAPAIEGVEDVPSPGPAKAKPAPEEPKQPRAPQPARVQDADEAAFEI